MNEEKTLQFKATKKIFLAGTSRNVYDIINATTETKT